MASNWYDDIFATRKNNFAQGATRSAQDLLSRDLGEFKGYATMSKDSASNLANIIYPTDNSSYNPGNPWYDMNSELGESSFDNLPYDPNKDKAKLETLPHDGVVAKLKEMEGVTTYPFDNEEPELFEADYKKKYKIESQFDTDLNEPTDKAFRESSKSVMDFFKDRYDKYKSDDSSNRTFPDDNDKTNTGVNVASTNRYFAGKTVVDDLLSNQSSTESVMDAIAMTESRNRHMKNGKLMVSPKGALGKYQLMPATAAKPGYGVKPIKNLRTASEAEHKRLSQDYFMAMLMKYGGDKEKAYAAYNAGPTAMDRFLKAAGEGGDWKVLLSKETKNFLKEILKYGGM
jgi:hypothetical protein|tara:strand:+ start:581 stop:1612 length:1032 start_codon:yes stop_codon:yes gene_type:complete